MRNIKLVISYDGTAYRGWQKTVTGPSVEETLEKVLRLVLQEPVSLQAASRTDAGVHAKGQVVNFFSKREAFNTQKILVSLNQLLPKDIAVLEAETMSPEFHPTLDSKAKIYHYSLCMGRAQLPHWRLYSWHFPYELNLASMEEAVAQLKGSHDFSAFCNSRKGMHYQDYTRCLAEIKIKTLPDQRLCFVFQGDHFLYKMVRNLTGLLVYVGKGKIDVSEVNQILTSRDRTKAALTAPAHGLSLHSVLY